MNNRYFNFDDAYDHFLESRKDGTLETEMHSRCAYIMRNTTEAIRPTIEAAFNILGYTDQTPEEKIREDMIRYTTEKGIALMDEGRMKEAEECLGIAALMTDTSACFYLGNLLFDTDRKAAAEYCFARGAFYGSSSCAYNLGAMLNERGDSFNALGLLMLAEDIEGMNDDISEALDELRITYCAS